MTRLTGGLPIIFNAIISFINTGIYTDPLSGTSKAAKHISKIAKIRPKKTPSLSKQSVTPEPSTTNNLKCSTMRLDTSGLKYIIAESIKRILQEQDYKADKVLGEYNVLNGGWWDGLPHGLESKGYVQDVRMYDKRTNNDSFETIALFRRCDNLKFFYARIVPVKGKETKWEPIPLNEVPEIIRKDIKTVNPQGHKPYLRF